MKKLFALPLAAFLLAACSDTTAPDGNVSGLTPRFGQNPPAAPPPAVCGGGEGCATFDDAIGIAAASSYGISSLDTTVAPSGEAYSARFGGSDELRLNLIGAGSHTISFNLYIIGAWHGQNRKIVPHIWELATRCGVEGALSPVIHATFSNRDGSVQSFPNNYPTKKTSDAFSGSTALNGLNYISGGTEWFNVRTVDVADVTYNIERTITNSCADPSEFQVVMHGINLPALSTASWGIDNLSVN